MPRADVPIAAAKSFIASRLVNGSVALTAGCTQVDLDPSHPAHEVGAHREVDVLLHGRPRDRHEQGNADALQDGELALPERVEALVRGSDVLIRYGGDEFVLLLPDTARAEAMEVAFRLVDGVKAAAFPGSPPLSVSVSLGVATYPDDGLRAEDLLETADRRNYLAKWRGLNVAVGFEQYGRHNFLTAKRLLPGALEWLAPRLAPYAPGYTRGK